MGPLYVIRTGLAAEKKAARLSILLRILDGRQFSCLSNSEARFPMKSSHSLQRRRSTQVYPTLKGEFLGSMEALLGVPPGNRCLHLPFHTGVTCMYHKHCRISHNSLYASRKCLPRFHSIAVVTTWTWHIY